MGNGMKLLRISESSLEQSLHLSSKDIVYQLHKLGEEFLSGATEGKVLTHDNDGVLSFDDLAATTVEVVGGSQALHYYGEAAQMNVKAVDEGMTAYCWYAPTVFASRLLQGLSPEVNKEVAKHIRAIPGARRYVEDLDRLGYDVTVITAGHQECAQVVSESLGLDSTVGTQFGVSDGLYDGSIERFIGGRFKQSQVTPRIRPNGRYVGTHIGDSWSDVDALTEPGAIAFNPGCYGALDNASISVIGTSIRGLTPLLDRSGSIDIDGSYPYMVVVREASIPAGVREELYSLSRSFKKQHIPALLDAPGPDVSEIRTSLERSGVDWRPVLDWHLEAEDFDRYAKEVFAEYVSR